MSMTETDAARTAQLHRFAELFRERTGAYPRWWSGAAGTAVTDDAAYPDEGDTVLVDVEGNPL